MEPGLFVRRNHHEGACLLCGGSPFLVGELCEIWFPSAGDVPVDQGTFMLWPDLPVAPNGEKKACISAGVFA